MSKLKQIEIQEIESIVIDKDIAKEMKETEEPIYKINSDTSAEIKTPNQLINIEIALRRCRRVGMFKS